MKKSSPITESLQGHKRRGLLNVFHEEQDLNFMSEVDAAIHRKGSSIAYLMTFVIAILLVVFVL